MANGNLDWRRCKKKDNPDAWELVALPTGKARKVAGLVKTICKAKGLPLYKVGPQVGMSTGAWSQFIYYGQLTNRELEMIKAWAKQFRKGN